MESGRYVFGRAQELSLVNSRSDEADSSRGQCNVGLVVDEREARITVPSNTPEELSVATKDSPLYRLPEKVRAKIFAYVLSYSTPIPIRKVTNNNIWFNDDREYFVSKQWRFTPPMMRTCQQIRHESAPIFFASNAFIGTLRDTDITEVTSWLQDIDSTYLSLVKELTVDVEPTSFNDVLDIGTAGGGNAITKNAWMLAQTIKEVGLPASSVKIDIPRLRRMTHDYRLFKVDSFDAQHLRLKWVTALEDQLKAVVKETELEKQNKAHVNDIVRRFTEIMGQSQKATGVNVKTRHSLFFR